MQNVISDKHMRVMVISPPENLDSEHSTLVKLFEAGLEFYHVRKPGMNFSEYQSYLEHIPAEYHSRLILHSHFSLIEGFPVKGVHIKAADNLESSWLKGLTCSASIHSLKEARSYPQRLDYLFLSPLFDSISKKGYLAGFDHNILKQEILEFSKSPSSAPLMALGGVAPENVLQVKELNFQGAALLGTVWNVPASVGIDNFKKVSEVLCGQLVS